MRNDRICRVAAAIAVCLMFVLEVSLVQGQGIFLSSAGPINRGMGGASTAAPIDALGAIYWNPAAISGLESTELEIGLDFIFANHTVSSTLGGVTGSTNAEAGVVPLPNVGWVYHTPNPAITVGLGVNAIAGFKTNLLTDPTNPILAPPPAGLGRVSSEATFLQLAPVVSIALNEKLSIGGGPLVTMAQLGVEPFVFDAANADGTFSPGQASRYHWGGGAQAGVYYIRNRCWSWGASIKSPAWMEEFRFFSEDENGNARVLHKKFDLPMVVSLGASYTGKDDWLFAVDVRYFDYKNTDGFGDPAVFDATGALQGLDWSNIFALAIGAQRRLSDQIHVRGGYTFNQNPVKSSEAFFNIASALIYQHMFSAGGSYNLTDSMAINLGYSYMLKNSRTGPIVLPGIGAVPGSSFTNELDVHLLSFGIVMRN